MTSLHNAVHQYLSIRRALGYKLAREGRWLLDFASFIEEHASSSITTELTLQWATQSTDASVRSWAKRLTMVRGFASYLHATDATHEIPSVDLLPCKAQRLTPYIYSPTDILALLQTCAQLPGPLRPHTYRTLLGLLAVSGMRVGEAIDLNRSDIHEHDKLVIIRSGKHGKSREVPLHHTTITALKVYAKKRDHIFRQPKSESLFISQSGQRLRHQNVWKTFARLRKRAGLERPDIPPPRIHDLRHTFAVTTLTRWYEEGVDVEPRLASLSAYLGHVSPSSTYWYLTATPELLALVTQRLETTFGESS